MRHPFRRDRVKNARIIIVDVTWSQILICSPTKEVLGVLNLEFSVYVGMPIILVSFAMLLNHKNTWVTDL